MRAARKITLPKATADQYERVLARAEEIFRANKTRHWVFVILKDLLNEEIENVETAE